MSDDSCNILFPRMAIPDACYNQASMFEKLDEHTKRVALTNFTSPPGPWAVATLNSREERNARSRERHLRDAEVSESRSRSAL